MCDNLKLKHCCFGTCRGGIMQGIVRLVLFWSGTIWRNRPKGCRSGSDHCTHWSMFCGGTSVENRIKRDNFPLTFCGKTWSVHFEENSKNMIKYYQIRKLLRFSVSKYNILTNYFLARNIEQKLSRFIQFSTNVLPQNVDHCAQWGRWKGNKA